MALERDTTPVNRRKRTPASRAIARQSVRYRAIGASNAYLYRDLLLQITVLVAVATVLGTVLALGAGAGMPPMMAFDPDPGRWGVAVLAIFGTAYLGSLFSLRSILKIDPATALGRTSA